MSDKISLDRTGMRPLSFEGEILIGRSGHDDNGTCNSRWWEIGVYQTNSGKLVLYLEWNTNWQSEKRYREATVFDTPGELATYLEKFDPICKLVGYPISNDQKYAERQRRIEQTIRDNWGEMVSGVLQHLEIEETIE